MRRELAEVVLAHETWMTWNTFLAVLPWCVAVVLFRRPASRRVGPLTALGAIAFVALLPNAAYVLTDVVHLPGSVRAQSSDLVVLVGVLPLYAAFFAVGFLAYVDSIRRLARWVVERGWLARTWPLLAVMHLASAVGIYAGRIHRFNSWDLVTRPLDVLLVTAEGYARPMPIAGTAVTFAILAVGFVLTRPALDAAIAALRPSRRATR